MMKVKDIEKGIIIVEIDSFDDEELPIIETKKVTYKIEKYEDKRILKVKACKNNEENIAAAE